MHKKNYKSMMLTAAIILLIGFLAFFNYYYFFKSPQMIEVNKVNKIVEQFELLNDKEVEFESRYFYDQAYYTASDANDLYVFNDQGKLLLTESLDNLDFEALRAKHNLADDISFAYAIHEDELVYAVYDDKYEYLYSVKTNELVLKFRKGIVND
ncbi:MAG: hypothetical protein GX074_03675 [Erysipelothrix sp.]|nr:hypothetical protein [Erysipelothrix sp.]